MKFRRFFLFFLILFGFSDSIQGKDFISQDPDLLAPRKIEYKLALDEKGIEERLTKLKIKGNPKIIKKKMERDMSENRIFTFNYRGFVVEISEWYRDGKITNISETYSISKFKKMKRFDYSKPGNYSEENYCYALSSSKFHLEYSGLRYDYWRCGRYFTLDDWGFQTMEHECWDAFHKDEIKQCGANYSLYYSKDSHDPNTVEVRKITSPVYPDCSHKCFDIIPYLDLGDYLVRRKEVLLRDKPSRNGKILKKLNEETHVTLLEDTGPIEEIDENVAPWVKVRLEDGTEGYLFGIFLKKEGEFFP